ncbi:multicopper oxidase family protein [Rhodothermus marinus]|uniref:multicopper oxidase family protein n=1 Tax=Rhodothermus marinus TaxID=29549 RepID=UPI0012BA4037|nr:multicopper oxidase family protein [Rhodothermus marinus]BBM71639.1 sugar transporter [Rhodothermus marinus]
MRSRRSFLKQFALGSTVLGLGGGGLLLEGCSRLAPAEGATLPSFVPLSGRGGAQRYRLVAEVGEVEVGPGEVYRTWLYNGQFPGPEIRVREGDVLEVEVENRLPEGTTVHWHGLPVPNAMDGVPGLTQDPIPPGEIFLYRFTAGPAGSYLYHSHVGLQLDRGLIAPLVVEETTPHVAYDREYTVVLDDYLPGDPEPLTGVMMGPRMMRRRGMMGGVVTPPYRGLLVNGRLPSAPVTFEVKQGERVRFRLMNPSGATTFRVALAGHRMWVTHTDGRPVEPYEVDSLYIAMGERYDVVVEMNHPGAWNLMALPVEVQAPPARAVVRYAGVQDADPPLRALPEGLRRGRVLNLSRLVSVELENTAPVRPDRVFRMTLSGGMMGGRWTINGQAYPDADPLLIEEGMHVGVQMFNMSMMLHPMHLHGHFFRTGRILKDTLTVRPHMGRGSFVFRADNPGRWFFHCHNVYHLEAGMAREFRYTSS